MMELYSVCPQTDRINIVKMSTLTQVIYKFKKSPMNDILHRIRKYINPKIHIYKHKETA